MRSHRGFTLIELMIAVAIVAILASLALPSYTEYVRRGKVTEAITQLSAMRVKMEQYFQDRRTYVGACAALTVAPLPDAKNFTFTCPTLTPTGYVVQAAGVGSVNGFTYTIDEANRRSSSFTSSTGWTNNATCWAIRKDGSC